MREVKSEINKYLKEGRVTQITPRVKQLANQIPGKGRQFVENLLRWLEKSSYFGEIPKKNREKLFATEHLQRTAEEILKSGHTIACGEQAIIFIVLCRAKGIPVKYVEAVGLDFLQAKDDSHIHSHAFVETYLNNRWVLVDPSRRKIYNEINYEKRGFARWAEGIDFRDLKDENGKHYSWQNLDILKKETRAFKKRWKKPR
jgi:transglutaminase-like putative cysteine protease